jgi:hypothetical protein
MPVYVDDLVDYGVTYGRAGPEWCHLIADTLEELHFFAVCELGLRQDWFQDKRIPHYDLTKGKRALAIRKGVNSHPEAFERCHKMWAEKYREQKANSAPGNSTGG